MINLNTWNLVRISRGWRQ